MSPAIRARHERYERAVEMLSHDPRLMNIARFCYQFGLDPVRIARTDNVANRTVRAAAMRIVSRDSEAEASRAKSKGKR
jgi:hypothetical protein